MQTDVRIIDESIADFPEGNFRLSFGSFLEYLERRVPGEKALKQAYLQKMIEELTEKSARFGPVSADNIEHFEECFELIYSFLVPSIAFEKETLWALGYPMGGTVFYGTDSFYDLLKQRPPVSSTLPTPDACEDTANRNRIMYALILEKIYGYAERVFKPVYQFVDPASGLTKYFQIDVNNRFVRVSVKGELPQLNFTHLRKKAHKPLDWQVLQEQLPLDLFRFDGFSVITLTDITRSQALENIKTIIIRGSETVPYDRDVIESLQTMVGSRDVEFSLLPFLQLNGKIHVDTSGDHKCIMLEMVREKKLSEGGMDHLIESYLQNPEILLFNAGSLPDNHQLEIFSEGLQYYEILSYALIPVYHNNKITGMLEVYSRKPGQLNEDVLSSLIGATSLLSQLLKDHSLKFEAQINQIIKEKFTSIQPAVQWKFNQTAWQYLQNAQLEQSKHVIDGIGFDNVYPLYGAIDIKNSTLERNVAFNADMHKQLGTLRSVLTGLKNHSNIAIFDAMIYKCDFWLQKLNKEVSDNFQLKITDFLERDIPELLSHFKGEDEEAANIIRVYEDAVNPSTGGAFQHRRQLEASIQLINSSVSSYLEMFNDELQHSYPCYFEKFRSDGIEYDIYIGQSIAPTKRFNMVYLKNARLWQLTSMAALARITYHLQPQMERALLTTQLIFVNATPIDICFRTDERRFDVEGAYNIRYQIIKKRIDKVNIKNSNERLTQPGKIAMVYFSPKDVVEYFGYISYLQKEGVLLDDLEELELDELQGVNGLKALRIGVNYQ